MRACRSEAAPLPPGPQRAKSLALYRKGHWKAGWAAIVVSMRKVGGYCLLLSGRSWGSSGAGIASLSSCSRRVRVLLLVLQFH